MTFSLWPGEGQLDLEFEACERKGPSSQYSGLWTLWVLDPIGVCGLAQPGKGCSSWEEPEVGNCSWEGILLCVIGNKYILALGWWPEHFVCRGGVCLARWPRERCRP